MTKIERIKELTAELLEHCYYYYVLDNPTISDKDYDKLYDELIYLENETGFWLVNSPTRKVQGQILDGFEKVTHSKPMLSAAKTKDINEIKQFIGSKDFYCSYKLDGLTLCVRYEDGKFKQAITRGTGIVGEDVTEQAKMISNLPMSIPYKNDLELRGECVISWDQFNKINSVLANPYSHPRNLAAGSLRQLDTNITKERNLSYVVFECVSDIYEEVGDSKWDELGYMDYLGFETVERRAGKIDDCISEMVPELYKYPVDGLIFELCSKSYSKSLDSTSHHEGCRYAMKWADEVYETILRDIEWNATRTGLISPVAVFDEVNLDGALTTRATLHNVSIIESLELGIGDTITIYRSNMVIPKIDDNLTRSGTYNIPNKCPCCGHNAVIKTTDSSKFLTCTNPDCSAKKIAKFTHFVSRNCMNIDGMSEATLEKIISTGYLNSFSDIYHLSEYKNKLIHLDGLGKKSVEKLLQSIEKSRYTTLDRFIAALGIPNVGVSAAKIIAKHFNSSVNDFISNLESGFNFSRLKDFGVVTNESIHKWYADNKQELINTAKELYFQTSGQMDVTDSIFSGKTLCVTGKLNHFSRDSINAKITSIGAKASNTVSKNTDYLITNEASGSSKYKKAIELNIPIITEEEFLNMLGE